MFQVLDETEGKLLALHINGKLLHADYQQFIPMLERLIDEYGSVRCVFEMDDFEGVELRALWDDLKFDVKHGGQVERCAMVGNRSWQEWMVKLAKPLFRNAKMKYFDVADRSDAYEWIREGLTIVAGR